MVAVSLSVTCHVSCPLSFVRALGFPGLVLGKKGPFALHDVRQKANKH